MVDIVERLRIRIHTSEDETALTNEAADEIERLQEALRLERQLRDSALALANDLQNELNRMNGHTWSVAAALQQNESE